MTCTLPTDTSIASGSYAIWVSNQAGSGNSGEIFTYKKTPEILSMSPVRYNLYGDKPVSMVGGEHHSLLLASSGSLFGWGSNDKGQVGNGSTETVNEPMNITGLLKLTDGEHIIQVGTLGYHSLALTNTGRVFSWGDNENGEVGNGGAAVVVTPTDITANFDLDDGDQITQLVVGWKQSFVLTKLGKIYAWGSNEYGQLGFGDNVTRRKPEQLSYAFDGVVIAMATDSHTVAVTDKGKVYSWGFNGSGQLGNGSTSNSSTPVDITSHFGGAKITKVWAGSNNSFALSDGGVLYAWGNNEMGELGISRGTFGNSNATKNVPTALASNAFGNSAVVQFSAGYHFSIAKTQSGKVYVWGDNDNGELGMGKPSGWNIKKYKDTPTELSASGLDASTITEVSATGNSLFALTNKGEIYYWGNGSAPQSISSEIDYSDVALYGVNLNNANRVFVDIQVNGNYDGDAELCKDLYISTDGTIVNCRIPSDRSIALGSYDVYVELKDGTKLKSPSRLEYYNDASW